MKEKIDEIIKRQHEFQQLADVNIDTIVASEINHLSETYLFKAIEEIIELRKTFPSVLNKWAKNQGDENKKEILMELSDVTLFMVNFLLARKIPLSDLLEMVPIVQELNFMKLKAKKMAILQDEMMRVPNKRVGLGGGNMLPSVIIIGQNPGESLNEDQNCWDNAPSKSAVGFLKRAIKLGSSAFNLDVQEIYFTNVVKEVTESNAVPSHTQVKFWQPFLERELRIVTAGADPVILAMGLEASKVLMQEEFALKWETLRHPSYYMRNGFTEKQYLEEELIPKLKKYLVEDNDNGDSPPV